MLQIWQGRRMKSAVERCMSRWLDLVSKSKIHYLACRELVRGGGATAAGGGTGYRGEGYQWTDGAALAGLEGHVAVVRLLQSRRTTDRLTSILYSISFYS